MSNNSSFSSRVIRSFLYSGAGNAVSKIINLIGLFIVLKIIAPSAFGIASIVLAIFAIIQAITEMGLGVAIVQAKEISRRELDSLFWLSMIITVLLYLFIYLLAPFAASFYREPLVTDLVRANGLIVIFFTFYFVPRNLLKKNLFFKELAIIDNASLLFSSVIMIALAYFGFGAWAIIGAEIANRFVQLLLTQIYKPFFPSFQFNWKEIKDKVYFGLYATGSRLLYNLYSNADYLIVGRIFGTEAVGIYTFAYRVVSDTVKTLTSNLNEVAYPTFSKLQNQIKRLQLYFFTIARGSMKLNSIILVLIGLFIDNILAIISFSEWTEAVPLIRLLAISAILRTVSPLIPQLLNAVGQAKLNFFYSLSNAIIMPIAFLIGAQFGLIGVGWAWVIGYPLVVLLLFYFGAKSLEVSIIKFIGKTFSGFWFIPLITGVGLGVQYTLNFFFELPLTLITIAGILLTIIAALVVVYRNEKDTIALLRGKIKKLPIENNQ